MRRFWEYLALRLDSLLGPLLYRLIIPFYPKGLPRKSFEQLYRRPDPWRYQRSPYEQGKYERMLELVAQETRERALEVGCSEGAFTEKLAAKGVARQILGIDISELAVERARERCKRFDQARFQRANILEDAVEGPFDLVFCMEVLYYLDPGLRIACEKLAPLLADGCKVLLLHPTGNLDLHRRLQERLGLRLVFEHVEKRTPRPYVATVLEKAAPAPASERAPSSPSGF